MGSSARRALAALLAASWLVCAPALVPVAHDPSRHAVVAELQIIRLRDSVYGREHLAVLAPSSPLATTRVLPLLLPYFEGGDLVRSLDARHEADCTRPFPDLGRAAFLVSRRPLLEQAIALRRMAQGSPEGGGAATLGNAEIARLPGESAFAAIFAFLIRCGLTPRIAVISVISGTSVRGAVRQASMGMLTAPAPASARLSSDSGLTSRLLCVDAADRPLSITLDPVDAIALACVGRGICALQVEIGLLDTRGVARGSLPLGERLGEFEWSSGQSTSATGGRPD
ncbi:hypothetical protein T492DRAFT_1003814 [Pavlovales sp. CCMP2436]|nr:hypothetical protein T492DRAFT_1003814 [Pavlovales sp. CCMP2436]|mmetsp:Transcript_11311/g.28629  ORF Transcript_11311/g.28629 Transcript_11311/m.28629 type:complete len:284 (-) Transcript_11311:108-959(-)